MVTTQDQFAISFTKSEARGKVQKLLSSATEEDARKLFRLCKQDQWNYAEAKEALKSIDLGTQAAEVTYAPFDDRWTIWDKHVAVHRRLRVSGPMLSPNISLNLNKKTDIGGAWSHVLVSQLPIVHHAVSSKEVNFSFPTYAYEGPFGPLPIEPNKTAAENLSPEFRAYLDDLYDHHYTPEEILGYIYAVLYALSYRSRYAEFLRIDFPRIPFPEAKPDFGRLSELGWALVQAHLLKAVPKHAPSLGVYIGQGDHAVEKVRWSPEEEAIWINGKQRFAPVPKAVWEFHIGGYQVLDKYLKSRKGRTLSLGETEHVGKVAETLAFTIDQMARIDAAYRESFPAVDDAKPTLASAR